MRRLLLALLLVVSVPARADEIVSVTPKWVTHGQEFVITGDFATLAAAAKSPRVFAVSADYPGSIRFDVQSVSSTELRVVATRLPRRRQPMVGTAWRLWVVPPKGAGEPLEAPTDITPTPPSLNSISTGFGAPGEVIELDVVGLGTTEPTVRFGDRKAKLVRGVRPLQAIVPPLASGAYGVWISNAIGAIGRYAPFVVLPSECPSLAASLNGRPAFEGDAEYDLLQRHLFSCEREGPGCARAIQAGFFDASPALLDPGEDFVATVHVSYSEGEGTIWEPPPRWTSSDSDEVTFRADGPSGPIRGFFASDLAPESPSAGGSLRILASFCALLR
jgi:hypothetical protein